MLIGEWNIENANARQHRVTFGMSSVSNSSEWVKGNCAPILLGNTIGFKSIKTVLVVKGKNREEIIENKSLILSKCLDPVILTLDNYKHKFYAVLKKSETEETAMKRWHLLTLEWNCYEYADRISRTFDGEKTIQINNPGNITTPAVVNIVPKLGTATLVITGLARNDLLNETYDFSIQNIEKGKEIILDGENGLVTEGGKEKAGDVEMWELPSLKSGNNTITVNQSVKITISFMPRYI